MDRFTESHRKQHRAHLHHCQCHARILLVFSDSSPAAPYRKIYASPRPVAFAPSPSPLRSHAKSNGRVKPDIGSLNKEDETLVNDSMLEKQSDPDSDFHWDETATLLSDLMDEK